MERAFPLMLASVALSAPPVADSAKKLHAERSSAADLRVGGEIRHLRPGSTRFLSDEDLLELPQETYTMSDDSHLALKTEISGVPSEPLARMVCELGADTLVVAIYRDQYRANDPVDSVAADQPRLASCVDRKMRDQWPLSKEGRTPAPYLMSHPFFKPAFPWLLHEYEPQIPYGVVRIEFQRQSAVLDRIQPKGRWPRNSPVEQGFRSARQNCFLGHTMGAESGTKAVRSCSRFPLASIAANGEKRLRRILPDPQAVDPKATMPARTDYDEATPAALTACFKPFDRAGSKQ
jgi:hypothetical protein